MWWKNVKFTVLLVVIIIVILFLIIMFSCGGPAFPNC